MSSIEEEEEEEEEDEEEILSHPFQGFMPVKPPALAKFGYSKTVFF